MKKIIPILFILSLFAGNKMQAQQADSTKVKIANAIAGYFELDRESIHAHFDKKIFFSNEEIWFKGYAFNKKTGTPFFETTNVFAVLYDDKGKSMGEQLLFSYLGTFSGSFKLGPALPSGRYHIQFYTNWMNNFSENESAVYPVDVINVNENLLTDYDTPDYSKINIDFNPEGGNFIEGVVNNLGVRISDCNGNAIEAKQANIVDASGVAIKSFFIDKYGYGKVSITPTTESYKAVFTINDKTVEAPLPKVMSQGLAMEVNNYVIPGKTIVKLRTNQRSLPALSKKPLFLVIHQNNKSVIYDINFNNQDTEKEMVIINENLYPGINICRIIDSEMQQVAERIIYQMPVTKPEVSFSLMGKTNDTLKISGKSNFPYADISISVLPEHSLANNKNNDVFGSLGINPYLNQPINNAAYFLTEPTKAKKYELDLFLMNQKSGKYNWYDILMTPPKMTYDFDIGLAIKGTINQSLSDVKKYRIRLVSPHSLIDDYSEINQNNEFEFKNLVFGDASYMRFSLLKIPSIPTDMKFQQQVFNRKRSFNKPFQPSPAVCERPPMKLSQLDLPIFGKEVIILNDVEITGKAKGKLTYSKAFGNSNLRGYKVNPEDNTSLLLYISTNGFNVTNNMGRVSITGRVKMSFNAPQSSPEVYINGRSLLSFDELQDISMKDVDEIYLNPNALIPSMKGNMGVIKIYLRKMSTGAVKNLSQSTEIASGFAKIRPFENPIYSSTNNKGFQDFGVIQWIPTVLTDENGEFQFEIPPTGAKTITVYIEGFTPEGNFISETKTLSIEL